MVTNKTNQNVGTNDGICVDSVNKCDDENFVMHVDQESVDSDDGLIPHVTGELHTSNRELPTTVIWDCKHPDVLLSSRVKDEGYPNVFGAKIPVKSNWDLGYPEEMLTDYHDREIVEFLRFGWPANRLPTSPAPTLNNSNHASALSHPEFISKYLEMEIKFNAVMGPFERIPFPGNRVGVSPLSTRPKRDTRDRRTILDLSFPLGLQLMTGPPKTRTWV